MESTTPAAVAVVAYGMFLALAFGLRTAVHWRQTGRSGFALPTRSASGLEWLSNGLFVLAVVGGAAAPLFQYLGMVPPIAGFDDPRGHALGGACFVVGIGGTLWAQFAMGTSWRVGVDPTARTTLVARGPFRWVRNPIFTNMLVATAGLVLLAPNVLSVATFLALLVGLELQVRGVEEPYLERVHGRAYRVYAATTGRFVPGVGRLSRTGP